MALYSFLFCSALIDETPTWPGVKFLNQNSPAILLSHLFFFHLFFWEKEGTIAWPYIQYTPEVELDVFQPQNELRQLCTAACCYLLF